jgi:hypothetical protein
MRKLLVLVSLLLLTANSAVAQGIKGTITNPVNEPLPFATIYIEETKSGTTTNDVGYFEIRLPPGTYTFSVRYMGYTPQQFKVEVITGGYTVKNIVLNETAQVLSEVEVKRSKEDPAYAVMRKAIAKAKYHLLRIQAYDAEIYLKGVSKLDDYPGLLRKLMEKEGVDTAIHYVSESVNQVHFEQPNTYSERVVSVRTNGLDSSSNPNQFLNSSFYEPDVAGAVSPLSPKAFGYYKFEHKGYIHNGSLTVNKIAVTPRSRGSNLFEGEIYIVDQQWSIYSLDLSTYLYGFKFVIEQIYEEIQAKVWMPVTHKFEVYGSLLGFDVRYDYLAAVRNYAITLNDNLPAELLVYDEKTEDAIVDAAEQEPLTTAEEANPLLMQKEFSRKELRKALREFEKQEREEQPEPEVISNYSYSIDSTASKADSLYWIEVRPIPLSEREVKSYMKLDSIAKVEVEEKKEAVEGDGEQVKERKNNLKIGRVITGASHRPKGKSYRLYYDSPLQTLSYNLVEGLAFELPLRANFKVDSLIWLRTGFTTRISTARENAIFRGKLGATWGPRFKRGNFYLSGGRNIQQFNPQGAIDPYLNSFLALLSERNFVYLYEHDFVQSDWEQQFNRKVSADAQLQYAWRYPLQNNTDFTLIDVDDRSFRSNVPSHPDALQGNVLQAQEAFTTNISLSYIFGKQRYRIRNDRKIELEPKGPKLTLGQRSGWQLANATTDFQLTTLRLSDSFERGIRGTVSYNIFGGHFWGSKPTHFADYAHFQGNQIVLQVSDPMASYRLLPVYDYSTADNYAGGHFLYQFRRLLVTQLLEPRILGWKEGLMVNTLVTTERKMYWEAGYSLDNIFRIFRIDVFASFEGQEYLDWGIRLGFSSLIEVN